LSLKREIAAEMKEFCNKEVEYTKLERLALDTWVEWCIQGKVFWDDNQNTNEHAVEDAKQKVDEVDADTKPPAKKRSKET
jgi:hypothetical protein